MHDVWAFRSTRTFKNHDKIFGPGEWIWADSTYPPETWSVLPFKKPVNGQLTSDQRTFNYWVSKVSYEVFSSRRCTELHRLQVRIQAEHAIGLLKGTFQSLKEIRIQLLDTQRHMIVEIGRGNPRVKKLYPYPYPPKPLPPREGKGFGVVGVGVQGGMGGMEYPQGYHSRVAINNHIHLCPNTVTPSPSPSPPPQHPHPHPRFSTVPTLSSSWASPLSHPN